jgi:transcriptional regulator with XRE-family HTH domain
LQGAFVANTGRLTDTNRRRTPGLRREDVAALAGVSVTWYTWLEQGRKIQVSADVLERVCTTLRMTADEREYLFALVQHRPAPPAAGCATEVSPTLARMLDALGVPALVMTARWDVIAWNRLMSQAFRHYERLAPEDRNLLRILLMDDTYQHDQVALRDDGAPRVVEVSRRLQPEPRRSGLRGADQRARGALPDLPPPVE